MNHQDDSHADDLMPVVDMLRASRPEATALELDAVKQRVRARVAGRHAGRRARSANLMKSRLAILSMLVVGMLASTGGVGLAITGLGGSDASIAQYGTPTPTPTTTPGGGVLGQHNNHNGNGNGNGNNNGGTPTTNNGGTQPLQTTRQVETGATGGGQLPFTGFLAIPVLLGGVVLLTTGLILRRRTGDERS
jgi:hypothetical protein